MAFFAMESGKLIASFLVIPREYRIPRIESSMIALRVELGPSCMAALILESHRRGERAKIGRSGDRAGLRRLRTRRKWEQDEPVPRCCGLARSTVGRGSAQPTSGHPFRTC